MSISFAGLGIVSLQNPFTELAGLIVGKGDIRTILCLLVFCVVSLVLAYLTNPSESSFRSYLTELSFRQHLSRLDENCEDGPAKLHESSSRIALGQSACATNGHILPFDGSSPFHFANRASVSLRTPKHVFHSFGIFTVAAMIPLPKSSTRNDCDSLLISDSWYIGAFGKWWRGGVLETWYQDVISRSKDEESWSSGILSMKSLDMLQDFAGPTSKAGMSCRAVNGSPPKLRNRERAVYKNSIAHPRSTTPPPLPKSASLPLHATRALPVVPERPQILAPHLSPTQPLQVCNATETGATGASVPARSPSTLFDQSPRIAHVLEQITTTKTSLADLHAQLHDYQTSASQTHASLQEEVNSHRERKRIEDATKSETKSRTKALDDSKRSAEGLKREADKKLKATQTTHDQASCHIRSLDTEIAELRRRAYDDEEVLRQSVIEASSTEQQLTDELECKRQEIRAAEDTITALTQRARELEDQLNSEREKLQSKKDLIEGRRMRRPQTLVHFHDSHQDCASSTLPEIENGSWGHNVQVEQEPSNKFSYRPHLLVDTLPTLNNTMSPTVDHFPVASPTQSQYDTPPKPLQASYSLSGLGDDVSRTLGVPISSPTGQTLIPSGLITSLDNSDGLSISRSFQSDSDPYLERRDKNTSHQAQNREGYDVAYNPFSTSRAHPVQDPPVQSPQLGSFEGHPYSSAYDNGHISGLAETAGEHQLHQWTSSSRPNDVDMFQFDAEPSIRPHQWLPAVQRYRSRKGLNPDAKEFSLPRGPPNPLSSKQHSLSSFDNLNPNGLGSSILTSATSANDSLLRAFAPSPAEREALQRAMGNANTSFERLPSLSDVGSIPSSPSHVHALPINHTTHTNKRLPSWLPAFPRGRKSLFSPWDDEEPLKRGSVQAVADVEGNRKP